MNFTELVDEVILLTNRPDLVNETKVAVKSATLKAHQLEFFYRDLVEQPIQFTSAEYLQAFTFKAVFSNWRALKYIRQYENGVAGKFLEIISAEDAVDTYGYNRTDVCYGAGDVLQIRNQVPYQYYLVGYYKNPNVVETTYSSWIAEDVPYAIVFEAAAIVSRLTGMLDKANTFSGMAGEHFRSVRTMGVLEKGE